MLLRTVYPILIDISRLFYRRLHRLLPTGIDRVSQEYVRHYAYRARAVLSLDRFSAVLSARDSAAAFDFLLDQHSPDFPTAGRLIAKACFCGWAGRQETEGAYVFNTGHAGLENRGYVSMWRRRGRPIFVINDLIPITHPEYVGAGGRARHLARIHNTITMAHGIIAISHDTLDALQRFADTAGLSLPPAVVAPLASGLPQLQPQDRPFNEPYFVMLGTIEPRKNHWMLLQLWRRLVETRGPAAPKLVVIGQRGWECENVVDLLERCEQLRGFVFELNCCSDQELITFLHHAQALLFSSFAEGYGLPLVEALSLKTPVIASNLPVFNEIAGDVPEYADPLDGKRWMDLINDYASPGSALRAAQLRRIGSFQPTSWKEHFMAVDNFLGSLESLKRFGNDH